MLLPPSDVIADEQHDVPTTISRSANKTWKLRDSFFSGFLVHLSRVATIVNGLLQLFNFNGFLWPIIAVLRNITVEVK